MTVPREAAPARTALLDAAEALVAERGVGGLSVREVQTRAGQSNKTAVQYHFGSREALLGSVIEVRMRPVNALRWHRLGQAAVIGDLGTPDLVRALVEPLAAETLGRPGSRYARFLLQAMVDPGLGVMVRDHLEADSFRTVYAELSRRSPHPDATTPRRLRHLVNLTVITLASHEGSTEDPAAADAVTADLVASCVAVLMTPSDAPGPGGPAPPGR